VGNKTKIIERLDRLIDGMDKLVDAIPKPSGRLQRVIEILITVATVAGVLSAIDIVKNWLGG
jgi:hypothetical protein